MTVAKKNTSKKKLSAAKSAVKGSAVKKPLIKRIGFGIAARAVKVQTRIASLLGRRPHRSLKQTRRRDYVRPLRIPGYWAFTNSVRKTLWQNKKLFIYLTIVYSLLTVGLVGMTSQDTYTQLGETLRSTTEEVFGGNMGEIGEAGLLLLTGVTGSLNQSLNEAQQVYAIILSLFTWLTTVWLLRAIMAGRAPKLRDGLYNSGSPVLATFLVGLLLVVQLIPVAIAAVGFGAATSSGLLDGGVEAMLFWTVALLLGSLSLYWITSTLLALVVVTLPGMYPMQAIKTAGDLVIGRRLRVLLRILWLGLVIIVVWAVIMVPIILFDTWVKGVLPIIEWLPLVPVALMIMSVLTTVWISSYVYLLYRRIVDDDAAPA